ncbi:MAG TPA: hypothetical protein VFD39_14180 [Trueperaceae bacterium]|nr:hypothetical protein [Trueperaceae bacterium]
MKPRTLFIIAAVIVIVVVVVLAGVLPQGAFAVGDEAPAWVEGISGLLGPRSLAAEDLGPGTTCAPELARALTGAESLQLSAGAGCRLDVPPAQGFLVRPRAVKLLVESGTLQMTVVQRGRGNSLEMAETFGRNDEPEATFGERGGTVVLTCFSGCVLSFEP